MRPYHLLAVLLSASAGAGAWLMAGPNASAQPGAAAEAATTDPIHQAVGRAFDAALLEARTAVLPETLRAARRTMDDPWVARGEHYEVSTAASPRLASWAAASLDSQLESIQQFLGTKRTPDEPFRVVILPDLAAYSALGDDRYDARSSITGGFFADAPEDGFVASYEAENYNLMLQHLVYGAFLQYADFLAPSRQLAPSLEQSMASFFAARASTDLAKFTFEQFEAIRDSADRNRPWTPVGALMLLPLGAFAPTEESPELGAARRVQLVQLVSFLQYYYEETRIGEDGKPGEFQDYVQRAFTGQNIDDHPFTQRILARSQITQIDGLLKAFRGWSSY